MSEGLGIRRNWLSVAIMAGVLAWMVLDQTGLERILRAAFPDERVVVYERQTLGQLMVDHLTLVAVAGTIALVVGLSLGLFLLTPLGARFRDLILNLANLGQTFPSIAVMALIVPAIGYGWEPVIVALVAYSVLPVMLNVVAGVENVPEPVVDAARGLGMSRMQRFRQVQFPLAFPVILGGIKNMLVIAVSAATLGAIVGAGGLGVPIMAGVMQFNNALILEGAIPSALMALIIDRAL